ncbi:RadC family protein [Silanimonas lenta]|uniref:RadC family protein n=1 Tax=Silanimonas lenta TaxID=265429 RepID=UPI000428473B|nr:DNA repair protein RadC [Silanimonas lenta]
MSLRHWPDAERPRERLLAQGAEALSDAELLALLLGTGPRGSNAVAHAKALLAQCGGLRGLLDRPPQALLRLPGLGPARAGALCAALALGRRHLEAGLSRGAVLDSPALAGEYFARWLRAAPRERFGVLFLDNRHRLLAAEVLFEGGLDQAAVHPRVVAKRAIELNAAAVLLGHNHPSGMAEPSAADRRLTQQLKEALALVEVRLLDHFVVGDGPPVSMAGRGWV